MESSNIFLPYECHKGMHSERWKRGLFMNPFYIKDITKFSGHSAQRCFLSVSWIYYCHSSKSTGKETGKMYLCAVYCSEKIYRKMFKSKILKKLLETITFQVLKDILSNLLEGKITVPTCPTDLTVIFWIKPFWPIDFWGSKPFTLYYKHSNTTIPWLTHTLVCGRNHVTQNYH